MIITMTVDEQLTDILSAVVQPVARNVCRHRTYRPGLDDLAQEAALAVWAKRDRYDPARSSLRTWANYAADYACREAIRREGGGRSQARLDWIKAQQPLTPLTRLSIPEPSDPLADADEIDALGQCLTPCERLILRLHDQEGLTLAQVARKIGLCLSWTSRIRLRALQRLRSLESGDDEIGHVRP